MDRERLGRLVEHLRSDPPGFDIGSFLRCVVGQCPSIFPEWWYRPNGFPQLHGYPGTMTQQFGYYFDLAPDVVERIVYPRFEATANDMADIIEEVMRDES